MTAITRDPSGDQSTSGAVAYSSGTTGYNLLTGHPDTADPLTTYVELGTTANSYIMFTYSALNCPPDCTIDSVVVNWTDEEPSSGTNSSCGQLRVGTTMYANATTKAPSTTTTQQSNTWTTNPATSAAWTPDQINNVGGTGLNAFGVKGPDSNPAFRIGSVQLVVNYTLAAVTRATGLGAVTVTGYAPNVGKSESVASGLGALTVTGYTPTVSSTSERLRVSWVDLEIPLQDPVAVTTGLGALTVTGYAPTAVHPEKVSTGLGVLTLDGQVPTATKSSGADTPVATGLGALALTGYAPNVLMPLWASTGLGTVSVDGQVPTAVVAGTERLRVSWVDLEIPVQDPVAITAGLGALTVTGIAPTVSNTGSISYNVPTGLGQLSVAGLAPAVAQSWTVNAGLGSLSFTGWGPTVTDSGMTERLRVSWVDLETPGVTSLTAYPGAGSVVYDGQVPTSIIGGLSPIIPTGLGSLTFSGQVPAAFVTGTERLRVSWVDLETPAAQGHDVYPSAGSLTFTGYAPRVNPTDVERITGLGSVVITGFAPSNTYTLPSPGSGSLSVAGLAPTVYRTQNQWITAGVGSVTIDSRPPGVTPALPPNQNIATSEGDLDFTGYEPGVRQDITILTDVGTVAIAGYAPVLDQNVATGVGAMTVTGIAPTVTRADHHWAAPGVGAIVVEGLAPTTMHGGRWSITTGLGALRINGQNPECVNSGDLPKQQGGGWSHWNPRTRTRKEIEEERIKFGVLPKPVQRALKRAAAKVVARVATEEDARKLIDQINAREEIAQVEAAAKLELSLARQRWKQVYDYIVQSLILQTLYEKRRNEEELAAELERQRIELMDQNDIAEIWSIWSQM